jgi:hypothetical protein
VRLGLTQVIFQRVLLGRLGKELGCGCAQRLYGGLHGCHVVEPEQALSY